MKKYIFLAAALMAMGCGMSSCSNEAEDVIEQNEQTPKVTKLVFTVSQDAETRASWSGNTPVFDDGDKVSLFSANNSNVELTAHVSGGVVTLEGEGTSGDADLYFVYPYYENDVSYTSGVIRGSFMDSSNPYYFGSGRINPGNGKYPSKALSLAKSADGGASAITFQGLLPIIKFTPSSNCKGSIKIDAGANLIPYCYLTINTAQSKVVEEGSHNEQYMNLPKEEDNYSFSAGTSYYFAVPPFSMKSGGKIKFIDYDDDSAHTLFTASADKDFVAGKIYTLNYNN